MPYKIEPVYEVECYLKISEKCRNKFTVTRRAYQTTLKRNNGKYICIYCSRALKASGRNNPNTKYQFNDDLLNNIDTEGKAYLLGWIASDGSVSTNNTISIFSKDREIFDQFAKIIGTQTLVSKVKEAPKKANEVYSVTINSKQMSNDVCRHLNITRGKKDSIVDFPKLDNEELTWAFIRGFFDGDGCVKSPSGKHRQPTCDIASHSEKMRCGIELFCKIPCTNKDNRIVWYSNNALDFMEKIYKNSNFRLERKYKRYLKWSSYVPSLYGHYGNGNLFRWSKSLPEAIAPGKNHASDAGYDLTIVRHIKTVGNVEFYDTGIKIQPDYGWFFVVAPRSSITKMGYMLANSIGIIDRTYTGSVIIALVKIDPKAADLQLPVKIAQMIPMPAVHFDLQEVEENELNITQRGSGGFGSTGV